MAKVKEKSSTSVVDPPPDEISQWEGIIERAIALFTRLLSVFQGLK